MVYHRSVATDKRQAPISFRPGKLRTVIRQRTVRNLTEGQVAKRDLGRYYLLLGQALRGVSLTRKEAGWLIQTMVGQSIEDAMMGDPFVPDHINPSDELAWMIERVIRDAQQRKRVPPMMAIHMKEKVAAMTPLERAALMDALDRLPIESEEDVGLNNWEFIGMSFADDTART